MIKSDPNANFSFAYPEKSERPAMLRTLMVTGVAMTFRNPSTNALQAPTTAGKIAVKLKVEEMGITEEVTLKGDTDPSTGNLDEWTYIFEDGPIPVGPTRQMIIEYPNPDGRQVTSFLIAGWA